MSTPSFKPLDKLLSGRAALEAAIAACDGVLDADDLGKLRHLLAGIDRDIDRSTRYAVPIALGGKVRVQFSDNYARTPPDIRELTLTAVAPVWLTIVDAHPGARPRKFRRDCGTDGVYSTPWVDDVDRARIDRDLGRSAKPVSK